MPRYYVMDLDKTMPENVALDMPTPEEIAANRWLTDEELRVCSDEFTRTGFQGGLQSYRLQTDPAYTAELRLYSGRTIDVPSLFISGTSDWGVYQRAGRLEAMRDTVCTDLRGIHLIEGAGHWAEQEQPEEVNRSAHPVPAQSVADSIRASLDAFVSDGLKVQDTRMVNPSHDADQRLPGELVTFLLTDVEGSTALWEQDSEAMRRALARHDTLFEQLIPEHGGIPIRPRGEGDSRFAVFASAPGAVEAALAIQRAFAAEDWPTVPADQGPDRAPHRRGRAARWRLLRRVGESLRPAAEHRAWRSDPALRGDGDARPRPPPGREPPAGPGRAPAQGPDPPRARLSARRRRPRRRVPTARLARRAPEQPAGASRPRCSAASSELDDIRTT